MLDRLTREDFATRVEEVFRVEREDGEPLEMVLAEARELGGTREEGRRAAFSLLFRAPRQPSFEQGILSLQHPELGRLDLFLVPVHEDDDSRSYEAVFT